MNGSAACASNNCVFSGINGQSYDLSSLNSLRGPVADATTGRLYYFSVCDVAANATLCAGTHVCSKPGGSNVVTNNGQTLGFFANSTLSGPEEPFQLVFGNGDSSACATPGQSSSTVVSFECDTEVTEAQPRYIDTDPSTCTSYFVWRSQTGCPSCSDSDFQTVTGDCDGKHQTVTKMRQSLCNGPASVAMPSQSCKNKTPGGTIAAAVICVVATLVAGGIAVYLYMKNRKLQRAYDHQMDGGGNPRHSVELSSTGPHASAVVL